MIMRHKIHTSISGEKIAREVVNTFSVEYSTQSQQIICCHEQGYCFQQKKINLHLLLVLSEEEPCLGVVANFIHNMQVSCIFDMIHCMIQ